MMLFCKEIDQEYCYSKEAIKQWMKDHNKTELVCHKAIIDRDCGAFWCRYYESISEKGKGTCGKYCDGYKPRNGKSGICKEWVYCYEPDYSKKIILKV